MNMFMKLIRNCLPVAAASLLWLSAQAHTPLFDCFEEEGNQVVCEAGFSDGASAEGIEVRMINAQGRVLARKEIEADGSATFDRPDEEFTMVFTAGESHEITVIGDDIY
jgi:hypothetical protein